MEEDRDNKLFRFFQLGCDWVELCRNNVLYFDFHEGNILYSGNGRIKVIDTDDAQILAFPKEIEQYAKGMLSLYVHFGKEFGAAFRYGVICAAGKIGRVLYDILFDEYELTVLNKRRGTGRTRLALLPDEMVKEYEKWNMLLENSFVRKETGGRYEYKEFSYIELMERNPDAYRVFKETYGTNREALKHEYQVYFANGLFFENDFDVAASALTLSQIAFADGEYFAALYYLLAARERLARNEDRLASLNKHLSTVIALFVSKFGLDGTQNLSDYVFHETFRLRIQRKFLNQYYEIWYWEDFSKEHSSEDYAQKRQYGCYSCRDCNKNGFFDGPIDECELCGSKRIDRISLQEYIRLHIKELSSSQAESDDAANEDPDAREERPLELESLEGIPLCIQRIGEAERKGRINTAIELAKSIESFLQEHPELHDDDGFVIEKARVGGQIFYSAVSPNEVLKLFLEEPQNVKNDYESFVCHKLRVLYEKADNLETAAEYAKKIIELADCSRRWLLHEYVEQAYETLVKYYNGERDKTEALKYSNIVFTYHMLDVIENALADEKNGEIISSAISALLDIGKSNANARNASLAYSCYTLALRMHVYHHGRRHRFTKTGGRSFLCEGDSLLDSTRHRHFRHERNGCAHPWHHADGTHRHQQRSVRRLRLDEGYG